MRVHNRTRRVDIVTSGRMAVGYWDRLRGLIGHPPLADGEGLLLRPERSIHTFLMRFPIDVVYLDAHNGIVGLTKAMPPQRLGPWIRGTQAVLELPAGTVARLGIAVGDRLEIESGDE